MSLAPIVLFVYDRSEHTRRTLESLKTNDLADQSELFIYCDGPKENATVEQLEKINAVRKIVREKQWCRSVHIFESDKNYTHPVNLVQRVTELLAQFERIIVLEDDLILGIGFLKYMNEALELYKDEPSVMHISGYMHPVQNIEQETFFLVLADCWGWATWKRAWDKFNPSASALLNKITPHEISLFNMGYPYYQALENCAKGPWKSWDIRWYASVFIHRGLCLHPRISLVRNIGHDGSGVHSGNDPYYNNQVFTDTIQVFPIDLKESVIIRRMLVRFYQNKFSLSGFFRRVRRTIMHAMQPFLTKYSS